MGFKRRKKGKFEVAEKFVKKNKKNPERDKSSIKESAGGDEEVHR